MSRKRAFPKNLLLKYYPEKNENIKYFRSY